MKGLRLLPFFLLTTFCLQAQQLSLFTQYRENQTIINPAAVEGDFLTFGQNITFGASYRAQWVGFDNAPTTQTLRGSWINRDGSGASLMAGGHIINDQTGPTGFTGIYGRVAAVVSGDPEYSGLSIGLSAGYVQFRVDGEEINLREEGDVLSDQNQNQMHPDVGAGIFYYQGVGDYDYFYGGISIPQVLGLDLTFQDDDGEYSLQRVRHFYAQLGYIAFFGDDGGFLEPSAWVKYVQGAPINADINLRYQLPGSVWIGAGVSTASNMHGEFGFILGDNIGADNLIKIGYGFDYSFSDFGPSVGGTHEINVSFSLDR